MEQQYTDVVTQIKDRMDILDIVSQYVILKKKGTNYWGLCPFHNEKTPSFSVNPAKGIYKCFGCGEGGDAIAFLMKINNQSFHEVIKEQAELFGIELPNSFTPNKEKNEEKASLLEILKMACQIYEDNLNTLNGQKAFEYLTKRNINNEIIKTYKLGVSGNNPNELFNILSKTYKPELIEKAGLAIKKEGSASYIDRFRNRLMIPIISENGDIVGFGARALEEGQSPKYLNSPDTPVYNKSNILYGLFQAKDAIKKQDSVIIMEGYFDVISSQAHGVKNCVAACGTSLTQGHIKLISRYSQSRKIYLNFDTDTAGQHATDRSAQVLKEAFTGLGEIKQFSSSYSTGANDKYSCEIRVVAPPEGKDPDEFIREHGAVAYLNYVEKAPLLLDYQLEKALSEFNNNLSPNEKLDAVNKIMPILSEIKNDIILNEYIKIVSARINVEENAIKKQLKINTPENPSKFALQKINVKKRINPSEKAQKNLLSMYLTSVDETNIRTLNEKISQIEFNEKLRYVKNTIDKLINTVNNELDLINNLYVAFAEENEFKEIITDLVYISDSFKNLSRTDFYAVIDENIQTIKKNALMLEVKELREKYKNVNDNDIEAIKYQMMIKEKIESKYKEGQNK